MPTGVYKHKPRGRLSTPRRIPIRVIGPSIAYLPLTMGYFAIIDAEDIERVSQWSWGVTNSTHDTTHYARASEWLAPGKIRSFTLHRFLLGFPDLVDHKDCDGLHCWKGNLREADHRKNQYNSRKGSRNTSGFKGVDLHPQGWEGRVMFNGKRVHCGYHATPEEAADAVKKKREELHGQFARHS